MTRGGAVIYPAWYEEMLQLKTRLDQIEEELKKLREQSKIGNVEYHIENLTVESIHNGILDLGVHMGNEMDKSIQTNGDSQQGENRTTIKERLQNLEQNMREVQDRLRQWEERCDSLEERWQTMENQSRFFEQRLRYLEEMHP